MRNPSASQWRAFLRHRFRAHAQGWLAIVLGLLWGYYTDLYWHEPLWAVLPAAFLGAFFVVAAGVAAAAVLRFPWWGLAPLCFVSMACEWALRRLLRRPWVRSPQPRERALSNPFALWQHRELRRRRKLRRASPPAQTPAPQAVVIPRPARAVSHGMWARPTLAADSWAGLGDYLAETFEGHWKFWCFSAPLWIGLWLWLAEGMDGLAALIVSFILTIVFFILPAIPLLATLPALLSALLIGAALSPQERLRQVETLRAAREAYAAARATAAADAPLPAQSTEPRWLWPLLIGLIIGNAWGDDE